MIQWWTSLDTTMKILWAITLSASLIFVIQTVMTFLGAADIGGDFDINTDTDFSGDIPDVDGGAADAGTAAVAGATPFEAGRIHGSEVADVGEVGRREGLQSGGLVCLHCSL